MKSKGTDDPTIVNAILLFQRLESLSIANAKLRVRNKCFELEEEYLRRKEAYLREAPNGTLTADMIKWFRCQEDVATGFAIYNATTCRHHPPYEAAYQDYLKERMAAGAQWFEAISPSAPLLTGGAEVLLSKG